MVTLKSVSWQLGTQTSYILKSPRKNHKNTRVKRSVANILYYLTYHWILLADFCQETSTVRISLLRGGSVLVIIQLPWFVFKSVLFQCLISSVDDFLMFLFCRCVIVVKFCPLPQFFSREISGKRTAGKQKWSDLEIAVAKINPEMPRIDWCLTFNDPDVAEIIIRRSVQ